MYSGIVRREPTLSALLRTPVTFPDGIPRESPLPTVTINSSETQYRELAAQVRSAGLMNRRPLYYTLKVGLTAMALGIGWAALIIVGDSWTALAVAAFLAVMFTQVVFVGHDAGHQQIFISRQANRMVGLIAGNVLTGLSFGWWVPKHNAHHAHPNQVGRDPDIGAGAVAFTAEIARARQGLGRWLARRQDWLFFPLLLLEALALHRSSIQLLRQQRGRIAAIEAVLLVVHTAAYLTVVFWVLSPVRALTFVAVQQGLFGLYLGCTFAPNHKGMPIVEQDDPMSFVRRQVITARNITGARLTTFVFGGLNYQIEHHLFPAMPRPNLARAQFLVRPFCAQHDLAYQEDSLLGSYRQGLRHLRRVGAGDDAIQPQPVPVFDTALSGSLS
jgi:fatty acid desaturase